MEKLEIETDDTRKEVLPKGFTSIIVMFNIDGEVDSKRIWREMNLGKSKYCTVSDTLNEDISFRLI